MPVLKILWIELLVQSASFTIPHAHFDDVIGSRGGDLLIVRTAMNRVLTCCAEGRGDQWEALCLDLDIAVQGRSLHEVYESLNDAVIQYLEYVHTLPAEEQKRLLYRRVPLRVRLHWIWYGLRAAFGRRRDDGNGMNRAGFELTCPA